MILSKSVHYLCWISVDHVAFDIRNRDPRERERVGGREEGRYRQAGRQTDRQTYRQRVDRAQLITIRLIYSSFGFAIHLVNEDPGEILRADVSQNLVLSITTDSLVLF